VNSNTADALIAGAALLALVLLVKILADHITVRRITGAHLSDAGLELMLRWRRQADRQEALKWGLTAAALGVGLVAVDLLPVSPSSPAGFGVVIIAASAGLLGYHAITRRDGADT
jgi:peptidoglycan/LPS O-acetylase OafA/YrhL